MWLARRFIVIFAIIMVKSPRLSATGNGAAASEGAERQSEGARETDTCENSGLSSTPPYPMSSDSILDYLSPGILKDSQIMESISQRLQDGKLVVIHDAFKADFAEAVHSELLTMTFELHEGYSPSGFHFKHHNVYKKSLYSTFFNDTYNMLSSNSTRQFASKLTGRDTSGEFFASPSYYAPGDHSLSHTDWQLSRTIAFVWHLSKNWRPEWGGALYWDAEVNPTSYVHASFNTLVLFCVTSQTSHHVTVVSPNATEKRLAYNGWWSSSWIPSLDDDIESRLDTPEKRKTLSYNQALQLATIIRNIPPDFDNQRKKKLVELWNIYNNETMPVGQHVYHVRPPPCVDQREECQLWSGQGECEKNPEYMDQNCRKACNLC
jgi:Rps23 Pro-64 3,4-dihydroxylase Tpa1-like proline 4-hydroxylase